MRAMSAHVLNILVNSCVLLISRECLAFVFRLALKFNAEVLRSFSIPRLGRLEWIWPLRRLQVLELTSDLSLTTHVILYIQVILIVSFLFIKLSLLTSELFD